MKLTTKIEAYEFQCEAGPLALCTDWGALKSAMDIWVVCQERTGHPGEGGPLVKHTTGNKGWRFSAHTNAAEAQASADQMNREHYAGQPICVVRHYLETVIAAGEQKP